MPKWSESYASLIVGVLIVIVASIFAVFFFRNSNLNKFDKINTADSTIAEPASSYEIKQGDSLWSISEKIYGSGYNWVDLAKANNLENPGLIHSGNKLTIPDVQKITIATVQPTQNKQSLFLQNNGPSISGNSYTIQKGDYLWNIAVRAYGDGFKWIEIARANNLPNPDLIYAGSTLNIPR